MKKKLLICLTLALLTSISLYAKKYPSRGNYDVEVFNKTNICFQPDKYSGYTEADADGTIRLVNGRIILKKIQIPNYERNVKVKVSLSIESNGDRWDKTGSCFVLPKESAINLLTIAKGENKFPEIDSLQLENLNGVIAGSNYLPTLELMRFMTPFGVGFYSKENNELSSTRKPAYIDSWEESVSWEQDITNLYTELEGEVYVGIYVDTWTAEGYLASLNIEVEESPIPEDKLTRKYVLPVINTIPYEGQNIPDIFARKNIEAEVSIPATAKNIRLEYITTGHGGHSGGDEFVKQTNIIKVDNDTVLNFIPWRTDCASFRRFNPATGVWLKKREASYIGENGYAKKEVEEPLGSSDLSRSNWCPGSSVLPETVKLSNIKPGKHTVTFSIPNAQPINGDELNHWLISAYLVWEE